MAQSKYRPAIRKQAEQIVIPCNLRTVTQTDSETGTEETFYEYQEITLDRADMPGLNGVKEAVAKQLRSEVTAHIYQYYDQGTQATIQSMAAKADRLGDTAILDECEAIFDWIQQVLDYYDTQKQAVMDASSSDDVTDVNWNFEENVPKPSTLKGWREIKAMFN